MANPTTNYSFILPTPTDLVTDLPADFDVALQGVDTRLKALQPGTTAGDLAYSSATANTNVRLGIGTTNQVLAVIGGVPAWTTLSSGTTAVGCALNKSANQTLSNATFTAVTYDGENFDTDGFHSTTSNTSRITIPSGYGGKYIFSARATFASNITDQRRTQFRINGATPAIDLFTTSTGVAGEPFTFQATRYLSLSAGDFVEVFAFQESGGNLDLFGDTGVGAGGTFFGAMYIGA